MSILSKCLFNFTSLLILEFIIINPFCINKFQYSLFYFLHSIYKFTIKIQYKFLSFLNQKAVLNIANEETV